MLAEFVLGLLAVLLLAGCVLAWRLAQGPIDLSWIVHRERSRLTIQGVPVAIGGADLTWEGFAAKDQPLELRLRAVALDLPGDGPRLTAEQARLRFAIGPLLLGRFMPRSIGVDGAALLVQRDAQGRFHLGQTPDDNAQSQPGWPAMLGRVSLQDARVTVHDATLGMDWHASGIVASLSHPAAGGIDGTAQVRLDAGEARATLDLRSQAKPDGGSHIVASLTPVNPAVLARASTGLASLSAFDAPITLSLSADADADLHPASGRLDLAAGAGTIAAGQGSVRMESLAATLSGTPSNLHLDTLRLALAQAQGTQAPPPVIAGKADANRAGGRVHAGFTIDVDGVSMAELAQYWPEGTGGGARAWLTRNITAGQARSAHLAGTVEAAGDLSDPTLTALSGGLTLQDATVWWLRPIPPMLHADARVVVQGPDALLVTVQKATQDRLALAPDSSIRITGLQARRQIGDIDVGLSGPVADLLNLLDNPRLKLLSRGGVDIVDPAGAFRGRLTMHVPLEDKVTMDDIPVSGTATLTGIHLGRVVAGRTLDQATLAAKVTGDGLSITGEGAVAGIMAKLALEMDFRPGHPGQVLQHLTARGMATPAQLAAAGLPADAVRILAGGTAALSVDYAGKRAAASTLQLDADLSQASVATPFGWSKPTGQAAQAGGLVLLDHGRLGGVDNLHAEGPGLAIVSHAVVAGGVRTLVLDRLDLGRTSAHGRIAFPSRPDAPIGVTLSGPTLDLSAYFGPEATKPKAAATDADKPGLAWSATLDFDQVLLAKRRPLAPLHLNAASDGRRILHAELMAGAPGTLSASIVPTGGGRHVLLHAADAGQVLQAVGVSDLQGGPLKLDGSYDDSRPGAPLTGTATLDAFNVRDAPAIGRLLQVATLYGVADTLHGPGLHFSHLIAPFRWQKRVLHLANARAFSPSLGLTANGDLDLARRTIDLRGTVVPAYFFNQLLGDLPLIGRIFSPEKGGGLFAARYSVRGPLDSPKIGVNPLSALTPGFLRGVFGVFDRPAPANPHVQ